MTPHAPRSIGEYLQQLQTALAGKDAAVIQEALEACEEHLRAEVAASPDKSEGDVLEAISGSYGAPEDVAALYPLVTPAAPKIARMPRLRCFMCQQAGPRWPRPLGRDAEWSGAHPRPMHR